MSTGAEQRHLTEDYPERTSVSSNHRENGFQAATTASTSQKSQRLQTSGTSAARSERGPSSSTQASERLVTSQDVKPAAGRGVSRGNANHLLNFQYMQPDRAGDARSGAGGRPSHGHQGGRGGGRGGGGVANRNKKQQHSTHSKPQKYDRNKFLQANYRFLVSDAVDSAAYHTDADRMFDWEDVLQVELATSSPVQCPISLDSPPVCPQITPCGHIYSFPAIMQHLVNHGGEQLRRWAPCPLCFEPVVARDLRMLLITTVTTPKLGQELTLQLLKRGRTTIIPQPVIPSLALGATSDAGKEGSGGSSGAGGKRDQHKQQQQGSWTTSKTASSGVGAVAGSSSALSNPLLDNRFAKFAEAGSPEANKLWHEAASQLADYASVTTAEGGLDAAIVAPFIYMSLEALAARARRWAQRRAEVIIERHERAAAAAATAAAASSSAPGAVLARAASGTVTGVAAGLPDPVQEGIEAEKAVKQMFVAAAHSMTQHSQQAELQQQLASQFPSLAPHKSAAAPTAAGAGISGRNKQESGNVKSSSSSAPKPAPKPSDHHTGDASSSTVGLRAAAAEWVPGRIAGAAAATSAADHTTTEPAPNARAGSSHQHADAAGSVHDHDFAFPQAAFSDCDDDDVPAATQPSKTDSTATQDMAAAEAAVASANPASGVRAVTPVKSQPGSSPAPPGEADSSLMGTSPTTLSTLNRINNEGDFYMYQACDGQWVFLEPLCVRMLLAHYGTYEDCPPSFPAPVLELEQLVQVDLKHILPSSAIDPFAEELAGRERARKRKAAQEKQQQRKEAAAAARAAAAKSRKGFTAEELASMPALSSTPTGGLNIGSSSGPGLSGMTDAQAQALGLTSAAELHESLALQVSLDATQAAASPSAAPAAGISFARMAKLGYAATGPTLSGASPPVGGPSIGVAPVQPQGVWAAKPAAPKAASSSGPSISIPAPVVAAANHAALSATTLAQTTQLMQTLGFNVPTVESGCSSSSNSVNVVKSTRGSGPSVQNAPVTASSSSSWGRPLSGANSTAQGQQQGAVGGEGDVGKSKGGKKGKTLLFTSGATRKY